ncbi:hypothetical protein SD70_23350 [Gordoniibacillus kamchatkensis]|uniref:Uncharacterized protein n=1 Tax=Gordoniibacillus kamchatkensis TaxID=1590651 RepID=A0ABR5ACX8_9BACL|nr:hypothetical protein [Paenibacillus sp. VKM B-2647]KIL38896.1 hypothetical protein SD70_23350 [Paenibacillus sp. VKM B-2647]
MDRFYITYKDKILAGPMPEEDAEQKLTKLKYCFRNVKKVPEHSVKIKRDDNNQWNNQRSS